MARVLTPKDRQTVGADRRSRAKLIETRQKMINWRGGEKVEKYESFRAAEDADREFYRRLSGNERLALLLQLINHAPEQRLERI